MAPQTEHARALFEKYGKPLLIDDIIRLRADDEEQTPILAYPRSQKEAAEYEYFAGKDLDRFIDNAVRHFLSLGFKANDDSIVALMAPSNVEYFVTLFALIRLGYAVLCLSMRLPPPAIIALMQSSECRTIIYGNEKQSSTIEAVREEYDLTAFALPIREHWDRPLGPRFTREVDLNTEIEKRAIIMHSSGSTGLPKPISLTHKSVTTLIPNGIGLDSLNPLPLYHLYGVTSVLQAMWSRHTAYLYNAGLPLTNRNLVAVLKTVKPEAVQAVPYALQLIAETSDGIEELKCCKSVGAGGGRTPDELGNRLVAAGVRFGVIFGSTEGSQLGSSTRRADEDNSWEYIRIFDLVKPHIWMKHIERNQYELVYLKSHPALATSNSEDPPGSFHSKDIFSPHPTEEDAWKYVTRIDDRITLSNGEKVLPLPIEGRLRGDPRIREAVVVGVDQSMPGLIVFRATDELEGEEFLNAIWPTIDDVNKNAEAFSQITRDMIRQIPAGTVYPQTDKGNIIRARLYNEYSATIESMYIPNSIEGGIRGDGDLELSLDNTTERIVDMLNHDVQVPVADEGTDFFAAGLDSLKATQARRLVGDTFDLHGHTLPSNILYDTGNAKQLAKYIVSVQTGETLEAEDELDMARRFIDKYSAVYPAYKDSTDRLSVKRPRSPSVARHASGNGSSHSPASSYSGGFLSPLSKGSDFRSSISSLDSFHSTMSDTMSALVGPGSTAPIGHRNGPAQVLDERFTRGFDEGHKQGHREGYKEGYSKASEDLEAKISSLLSGKHTILLTGATGSMGAHILAKLVASENVQKVHCLVRGVSPLSRVLESLKDRGLGLPVEQLDKIAAYEADLNDVGFKLKRSLLDSLRRTITTIIHVAWPVNFNLPLSSFEPHIIGLRHLLNLSISTPIRPARLLFCSSMSTALKSPSSSSVSEACVDDLTHAIPMGYARSKLVGEHMCLRANQHGAHTMVLRIGQVIGDTVHGIWNDTEAIPLMVRSALTLKSLPDRAVNKETSWIPVDTLADGIVELVFAENAIAKENPVVNLLNRNAFAWEEFLAELQDAGLDFTTVAIEKWVKQMEELASKNEQDANPGVKLLDYYRSLRDKSDEDVRFDTAKAETMSQAMRQAPDVLASGLVRKMLAHWMAKWGEA